MSDAHETPEQVICEMLAVARLKDAGINVPLSVSALVDYANRFRFALVRDRQWTRDAIAERFGDADLASTACRRVLHLAERLVWMLPFTNHAGSPDNDVAKIAQEIKGRIDEALAVPMRKPRVCDLSRDEILAALRTKKNVDSTFTVRLVVDFLLSPASEAKKED